eukprot:15439224-Alexandrium_andersonii.AAC.1
MPGMLRDRLHQGKTRYLVKLQRDMREAADRRDQAALYGGARSLATSKPRPPRQVMLEDGDYARTPGQAAG